MQILIGLSLTCLLKGPLLPSLVKFVSIKTFVEFKFYFADAKTMLRNRIAGKFQYPLVVRQEKENLSAAVVILKPKSPLHVFSQNLMCT